MRRAITAVVLAVLVLGALVGLWSVYYEGPDELEVSAPVGTPGVQEVGESEGGTPTVSVAVERVEEVREVEGREGDQFTVFVVSEERDPVAGATVAVARTMEGALTQQDPQTTDPEGVVQVPDDEGSRWVTVTADGWLPALVPVVNETKAIEVTLMKPRVLRVRAKDARGVPIPEAEVSLRTLRGTEIRTAVEGEAPEDSLFVRAFYPKKKTDHNGVASFEVSPSQLYLLRAEKEFHGPYSAEVESVVVDSDWDVMLPGVLAVGVEWVDPVTGEALVGSCGNGSTPSAWEDAKSLGGMVIYEARAEFFRRIGLPGGSKSVKASLGVEDPNSRGPPTLKMITEGMSREDAYSLPAKPLASFSREDLVQLPGRYSNDDLGGLHVSFVGPDGSPASPGAKWAVHNLDTGLNGAPSEWSGTDFDLSLPAGRWEIRGWRWSHSECRFATHEVEVRRHGESYVQIEVDPGVELMIVTQDEFGQVLLHWGAELSSRAGHGQAIDQRKFNSTYRYQECGADGAVRTRLPPGEYWCSVYQWGFSPAFRHKIRIDDRPKQKVTFTLKEMSPHERAQVAYERATYRTKTDFLNR